MHTEHTVLALRRLLIICYSLTNKMHGFLDKYLNCIFSSLLTVAITFTGILFTEFNATIESTVPSRRRKTHRKTDTQQFDCVNLPSILEWAIQRESPDKALWACRSHKIKRTNTRAYNKHTHHINEPTILVSHKTHAAQNNNHIKSICASAFI